MNTPSGVLIIDFYKENQMPQTQKKQDMGTGDVKKLLLQLMIPAVVAQVVNLLQDLQRDLGLSLLFIAHDLAVVRHISHRVAIMYAGHIVELAPREAIYDRPIHPYTQALLSAVPVANPGVQRQRRRIVHPGESVDIANPPSGCRFHPRCPLATEQCRDHAPPLTDRGAGHLAACWNSG